MIQKLNQSRQLTLSLVKTYFLFSLLSFSSHGLTTEVCELPAKNASATEEEDALTSDLKQLSPEQEAVEWQKMYPQASSLYQKEQKFTPGSNLFEGAITEEESISMLTNLKRYGGWAAKGLEALGPVFDAAAIGLWADDLVETFSNEKSSTLDKVASVLYLVPIVSDGTRAVAQADHFDEHLQEQIKDITSQKQYVYKDVSESTQKMKLRIDDIFQATYGNITTFYRNIFSSADHNIIHGLKVHQQESLAWIHALEKTLSHLDLQYYKSIYYDIYKPPYDLALHSKLPYTPLECDARTLSNTDLIKNPNQQEALHYRKKLQSCLHQITLSTLKPLSDLTHHKHDNFTIAQWAHRGDKLIQAKVALVQHVQNKIETNKSTLEKKLIQQFEDYLKPIKKPNKISQYLTRVSSATEYLSFTRWVSDEFSDIPKEQLNPHYQSLSLYIKPYQVCSKRTKDLTSSFPLAIPAWPITAYCAGMQSIINSRDGTKRVLFDRTKSEDIKRVNKILSIYYTAIQHIDAKSYVQNRMKYGYSTKDFKYFLNPYLDAVIYFAKQCLISNKISCGDTVNNMSSLSKQDEELKETETEAQFKTYYASVKQLEQRTPIILKAFFKKVDQLSQQGVYTLEKADLLEIFNAYPFNQGWYIYKNYEQLGNIAPTLMYQHLKKVDNLSHTKFVSDNNTTIPSALTGFLQHQKVKLFQSKLKATLIRYERQDKSLTKHTLYQYLSKRHHTEQLEHCLIHKQLSQKIKEIYHSPLSYLPFWGHMIKQLIHQRKMYEKILTPLCMHVKD